MRPSAAIIAMLIYVLWRVFQVAPRSHWPDEVNKRDVAQKQPADWPKSSFHKVVPQRKT